MPMIVRPRSVLCTDLSVWPSFGNPVRVSDAILASRLLKENLVNRLLLYDQVVIPTSNLLALPILRLWLGDRAVRRLLEDEIIVLARYDRWFCYIGNGGGLNFFQVLPGDTPESREHNISTISFGASLEEAVDLILNVGKPPTSDFERPALRRLLLDKVRPISLDSYNEALRHETYTDILKSPLLRWFFAIRNTHLDRLEGIAANEVRTENFHAAASDNPPEIRAVLRIAFENLLLTLAAETATSLQGDFAAETLLKAKGQRLGLADAALDGFLEVASLTDVPDIGRAFSAGELSFDAIMRIREHRATADMRSWLDELDPTTRGEVLRAYVAGVGRRSFVERLPGKVLRFAATTLLNKIPVVGDVASFADSFLIEKWFPAKSTRLLIDGFRTVIVREQEFRMKGAQRNSRCPCGSGKKLKKCHGAPAR